MNNKDDNEKEKVAVADEADIEIFKKYGKGPYSEKIKNLEDEAKKLTTEINKLCGIRESETGLSLPTNWVIEVKFINFSKTNKLWVRIL
jgi:26S proteasome regulatory subunit T1